jgi:hypothetical protein
MTKQAIFLIFAALVLYTVPTGSKATSTQGFYDSGPEYRHHCKPSDITDPSCRHRCKPSDLTDAC